MVCRMKRKKMKFRLQPKLIMGLVFMAVVLVLALTSVVVVVYRGQMEEQYGKVAFDEATIAAEMIDGDMVEKYYATGEKDAYYEKVAAALLRVKQTIGLKYFYVVVPEEDVMVYIWDVGRKAKRVCAGCWIQIPIMAAATRLCMPRSLQMRREISCLREMRNTVIWPLPMFRSLTRLVSRWRSPAWIFPWKD